MPKSKGRKQDAKPNGWPIARATVVRWGIVLAVVIGIVSLLAWSVDRLHDPRVLPIRQVRIEGDFHHLDRGALARAVEKAARGGFFSVDVEQVKAMAEQVPWVDRAEVRRVWPDRLKIHVTEQVPFARWGRDGLVNRRGVLFRPDPRTFPKGPLPQLGGPDYLAREATQRYLSMARRLAPTGLRIRELRVDGRHAWRMTLDNGLVVKLGSHHMDERLARFVRLYPRLSRPGQGALVQVDLRYTNGFAVKRQPLPTAEPRSEPGRQGAAVHSGRYPGSTG